MDSPTAKTIDPPVAGDAQPLRFEPRWPVALSIVVVLCLLAVLPDRIRLYPFWLASALGVAVLAPIVVVGLTSARQRWRSVERTMIQGFVVVVGIGILHNLTNLIGAMLYRSEHTSGLQLLASSIAVWATNVFVFSLLFWQIDRGGPEARANQNGARPDWLFPQEGAPATDIRSGWEPSYIDYLYLGYGTATAFSTTDVMPLTPRAKLLMMLESTISLVTIVLVASRAINILGN